VKADRIRDNMTASFLNVLRHEQEALARVVHRFSSDDGTIAEACEALLHDEERCGRNRIIVSGVGKAGIVAMKVASTLSSTGSAAVFMHPVEALHGDLGFVGEHDCALLFSYSGQSVEVIRLARELRRIGCAVVVITSRRASTLGRMAAVCVETGEVREACYLGLAPSSSTTVMLAIGDALALAMAEAQGFGEADFGLNHPAGSLGQRFRYVQDFMRTGDKIVCVEPTAQLKHVIQLISDAKTGSATLVDPDGALVGIFTDGDLRRALLQGSAVLEGAAEQFASIPCHFVLYDTSIADALKLFQNTQTEDLPVLDPETRRVLGTLCLKDITAF
jgi:arabinose-5-phosphate isomerase